ASVPGAVTSLTATAASPTQVNLSWGAPSNNGGSAIIGYKIEVKKGSGSYETLVANSQSTATSFSHTGLTTGTTYYYRVSAVNSVGAGTQSETSATPKETTAPTVTATAISPTAITLTWVPPSQTYKQSITGYKIEEKIGQDSYIVIQDNVGTSTSYTISGLTTGKTYTYVVSAYFSLGASPRSAEATATPLTTSNASPPFQTTQTTNVNPPTNLVASPYSPTQINLSWSAPTTSSNIVGYKIEFKKGPGQFETLTPSTLNATTKYSHTNVETGTPYTYRIYTITSSGISAPSLEVSATATLSTKPPPPPITAKPPSPPTLSANLVSPTQINLYWTTPTNNGGASIIGYKIEYKIGSDSYRILTSKTTSTTYSHTGLLANTYSYRVYAINPAGTSVASNEVSIKTAEQKPVEEKPKPNPTQCGTGTIFDEKTQSCIVAPQPEPETKPPVDPEPEEQTPTTHIPGFPDPNKDPQYYIERYNSEAAYKAWFDRNFPGQTIYEVLGVPEPEPPELKCGEGTHLEKGTCIADEKPGLLGGGCLIATAAYGTELAPQVQALREIRDGMLIKSSLGTTFMAGFNEFYYSFSPTIADWERQSPLFKGLVGAALSPMLSTLSILNHVDIDSESELLGYGIGVVLLNAGIYLAAPAFLILIARNKLAKNS
ncbi:MAG: fibronectin type III domain-containing protein, partial [Candidatus Nitrosotenuis sp.]